MKDPALPPLRREMQGVVDDINRRAGPSRADRERITGALRARLGVGVLPEGFVPGARAAGSAASRSPASDEAPSDDAANAGASRGALSPARSGLGRNGWLGVVAGTGVVAGALGFVLGHGMAQREHEARLAAGLAQPMAAGLAQPMAAGLPREAAPAGAAESPGAGAPASATRELSPPSGASSAGEARPVHAPASVEPRPHVRPHDTARAPRASSAPESAAADGAPASAADGAPASATAGDAPSRQLSFSQVLERLERANLALRQGRAPLALIQLAELERAGGDVLREERQVTRALALCAIGDEAGARRVAAPLLAGSESSIYAPRLDASCARKREP